MPLRRIRWQRLFLPLSIVLSLAAWWAQWERDFSLWSAAFGGRTSEVKRLLDEGANPDSSWQGLTALNAAIYRGDLPSASALLEAGAHTAGAARESLVVVNPVMLDLLAAHGIRPTGTDMDDVLLTAVTDSQSERVAVLLKHGANPNARNPDDHLSLLREAWLPVYSSTPAGRQVIRLLTAAGAKP